MTERWIGILRSLIEMKEEGVEGGGGEGNESGGGRGTSLYITFPFSCLYLYLLLLFQKFSPCLLFVSLFLHLCLYLFLTLSLCPFLSSYFIYLCYLSIFLSFSCMPPYLTIISHFSLFLPHSLALSSIFSIRHYSVSLLWVLIVLSRISALSSVRNFPRTLIKENVFLKKKKKLLPSD